MHNPSHPSHFPVLPPVQLTVFPRRSGLNLKRANPQGASCDPREGTRGRSSHPGQRNWRRVLRTPFDEVPASMGIQIHGYRHATCTSDGHIEPRHSSFPLPAASPSDSFSSSASFFQLFSQAPRMKEPKSTSHTSPPPDVAAVVTVYASPSQAPVSLRLRYLPDGVCRAAYSRDPNSFHPSQARPEI